MNDIFDLIANLPPLTLTGGTFSEFKYVVARLDSFTLSQFQHFRALNRPHPPLSQFYADPAVIKECDNYISAWETIFKKILELFQHIKLISPRLKNSGLGADNILPIFIKLAPSNLALLTDVKDKLSQARDIIVSGETAYNVIQLYCVCEYHLDMAAGKISSSILSENEEESRATTDHYEFIANLMAQDIKNVHLYPYFYSICEAHSDYQKYIETEIYKKLFTEKYSLYSQFSDNKSDWITHVINTLRDNAECSPALRSLIEKHIAIEDIGYTLHASHHSLQFILDQLIVKYQVHAHTFLASPNKFNVDFANFYSYPMLFKYSLELMVSTTPETLFNAKIQKLIHLINAEQNEDALSAADAAHPNVLKDTSEADSPCVISTDSAALDAVSSSTVLSTVIPAITITNPADVTSDWNDEAPQSRRRWGKHG